MERQNRNPLRMSIAVIVCCSVLASLLSLATVNAQPTLNGVSTNCATATQQTAPGYIPPSARDTGQEQVAYVPQSDSLMTTPIPSATPDPCTKQPLAAVPNLAATPAATDHAPCWWYGKQKGTLCEYLYQPAKAASYAINVAGNSCHFFCVFQLFPSSICNAGKVEGTDCANFLSEALFWAGLPLRKIWGCHITGTECVKFRFNDAWAHANLDDRAILKNDTALTFSDFVIYMGIKAGYKQFGDLPTAPPVAGQDQGPLEVGYEPANLEPAFHNDLHNLEVILKDPPNYYNQQPKLDADESVKAVVAVGQALYNDGFGVGDILSINHNASDIDPEGNDHVAMIVGWGKPVDRWDFLPQPIQDSWAPGLVPYIVDHGPHTVCALSLSDDCNRILSDHNIPSAVLTGPKPYYALSWDVDITGSDTYWQVGNVNPNNDWRQGHWKFIRVLGPNAGNAVIGTATPTVKDKSVNVLAAEVAVPNLNAADNPNVANFNGTMFGTAMAATCTQVPGQYP